jgi:hypothetical protein
LFVCLAFRFVHPHPHTSHGASPPLIAKSSRILEDWGSEGGPSSVPVAMLMERDAYKPTVIAD